MSTEQERAAQIDADIKKADAARKDAAEAASMAGEKLDRILDCMDALGKRMDSYEAERKADSSRRNDEDKDKDEEEKEEKGDPKKLGADLKMVRKDSSAVDAEEIENYKREIGATHAIAADSVLTEIQSRAERAASAWGKDARHPWDGEGITAYRRRAAREHQAHSAAWKNVDLSTLSGQALRNATAQIFADSIAASSAQESYGETLREVRRRDPISPHPPDDALTCGARTAIQLT